MSNSPGCTCTQEHFTHIYIIHRQKYLRIHPKKQCSQNSVLNGNSLTQKQNPNKHIHVHCICTQSLYMIMQPPWHRSGTHLWRLPSEQSSPDHTWAGHGEQWLHFHLELEFVRPTTNGEQLLIKALSGLWPMSYALIQLFNELFLKGELNGWTGPLS